MPLQDQTLSISFNKGLNTKTDSKQILPGELLTLQNGTFTSVQEILKRNGYTPLSLNILGGGTISSGNSLGVFNDSLTLSTGTRFYSFSENDQSWDLKGVKHASSLTGSVVASQAFAQLPPSFRACMGYNDVIFGTWTTYDFNFTSNKISYSLIDSITLNPIYTLASIDRLNDPTDATQVVPLAYGTDFYAVGYKPSGTIHVAKVPTLTPGSVTYSTLVSTGALDFGFDAVQTSTAAYLLYNNTSDYPTITKYDFVTTALTTVVVDPTVVGGALTSCLYVDTTNNYLWVMWTNATSLYYAAYNLTTMVQTVAPSTLPGIGAVSSANSTRVACVLTGTAGTSRLTFYYTIPGTAATFPYVTVKQVLLVGIGIAGGGPLVYNAQIALKPYLDSTNQAYIVVTHLGTIQPTSFIILDPAPGNNNALFNATTPNLNCTPILKFQTLTAGPTSRTPGDRVLLSSGESVYPLTGILEGDVMDGVVQPDYSMNLIKRTVGTKATSVALGNNLNITGGQLSIYDGSIVAESGFNLFPEDLTATAAFSGSMSNGTYSYVAVYEWTDYVGNLHRSAPSIPVSVTLSAGTSTQSVLLKVFSASIGTYSKLYATTRVSFYRTQNGGTIYYKVGSIFNLPTQYMNLQDRLADSSIAGSTQLYTTGGEVENIGPPATNIITSFKNRIILVDAENPLVWWYSKQVIQGFPVEFSDLFTQAIDQRGGPITALSTMDDKLIFFKEYNIFYVIGDGPAPSGANNDFSYPQIITTDVGCINPASTVLIPTGIMFQSHKGIYLLDRGLNCTYIGAPVESFNAETITSAKVIPNTTQVRFTLASGTILVFDYYVNQWSQFTNLLAADSAIYKNTYTLLSPSGVVTEETPGVYTDSGAAIPLTIKTGWFSFGNLQGFQRIKEFLLLGESESNTALTISLSHNFLPTINQTEVIPITANARLQYRIFPQRQKCESMQITISDAPSTPLGEGLRLSALGFNIGIKKGLNKVPASNNYG